MPRTQHFTPKIHYSLLEPESLCILLKDGYDLPTPRSCEFLARGFNDTYRISFPKKRLYFRVYRSGTRSYDDVVGELNVLRHLERSRSVAATPVVQGQSLPIRRNDGELITTLLYPEGKRYGVLFEEAPGASINRPSVQECESIGVSLAQMHKKLDSFTINRSTRPSINKGYFVKDSLLGARKVLGKERYADLKRLKEVGTNAVRYLSKLKRTSENFGMCHGDVHTRNLRLHGNSCVFFDFDFCGIGFRAYDIATFYWSRFQIEHDSDEDALIRYEGFLKGYQSIRPLSPEESNSILTFVLLREFWAIGVKLTHSTVWGAEGVEARFWDQRFEFIDDWLDHMGQR